MYSTDPTKKNTDGIVCYFVGALSSTPFAVGLTKRERVTPHLEEVRRVESHSSSSNTAFADGTNAEGPRKPLFRLGLIKI